MIPDRERSSASSVIAQVAVCALSFAIAAAIGLALLIAR